MSGNTEYSGVSAEIIFIACLHGLNLFLPSFSFVFFFPSAAASDLAQAPPASVRLFRIHSAQQS